jgi:hypothetical protein
VPVESDVNDVHIPLTTSEAVARATVDALGLEAVRVTVEEVALARRFPFTTTHPHRHAEAK